MLNVTDELMAKYIFMKSGYDSSGADQLEKDASVLSTLGIVGMGAGKAIVNTAPALINVFKGVGDALLTGIPALAFLGGAVPGGLTWLAQRGDKLQNLKQDKKLKSLNEQLRKLKDEDRNGYTG